MAIDQLTPCREVRAALNCASLRAKSGRWLLPGIEQINVGDGNLDEEPGERVEVKGAQVVEGEGEEDGEN